MYGWYLRQNKKKRILTLSTAILLCLSLIILVIVLSVIFSQNKSTNTNSKLPTCDVGNGEKYYGLIGTPYKLCSVNACPLKQIDCCSIINKCNFASFLPSNTCPDGTISCSCNLNDNDIGRSCTTSTTLISTRSEYFLKRDIF